MACATWRVLCSQQSRNTKFPLKSHPRHCLYALMEGPSGACRLNVRSLSVIWAL